MAEIAVERATGLPLWAALLGLLALIVTVWLLFSLGSDGANRADDAAAADGRAPLVTSQAD